jgi:hypothetical protein
LLAPLSRRREIRTVDAARMNLREDSADPNKDVILNRHSGAILSQHVSFSCCGPMCGRYPQMRQDFISQKLPAFAPRAAKGISASAVVCVVLASGAAFGMAAQAALHHFALDLGSIHGDLIAGIASARAATAWWAWWLAALAAFFVGPLSASLARGPIATWWPLRGLRIAATAAVVLALAAIGGLQPAPPTFSVTTHAMVGLAVVVASTLLAGLGAWVLGGTGRKAAPIGMRTPAGRSFTPLPAAQPPRGGGSFSSGLPFLRFRQRHASMPGPVSIGRLAVLAVLALVVCAAVSALGSASVLVNSVAPGAVRKLAAANIRPVGVSGQARTLVLALLPTEERRRVLMPAVAMLDAPPPPAPKLVEAPTPTPPPEPRQRDITITATVGYGGPIPESELTFSKGYSRRRAAQLVANMTSPPTIPQLTAAINIKRIRAASLRFTQQERHVSHTDNRSWGDNRAWADNRSWGDNRQWGDNRGFGDDRQRNSRYSRQQSRYDRQARSSSYDYNGFNNYNGYDRHSRRGHGRFGNSFARAEPSYGRF